jgi:hypothetical protein
MANTKTSAMTALTGTGRISRPAARQGSAVDYRTVDNFTAAADPAVTDDVTDGYHAGSIWFNTTDNKLFVCQSPTDGAAVWRQVMDVSKNLSDLASASTARTNLGINGPNIASRHSGYIANNWYPGPDVIPGTGAARGIDTILAFPIIVPQTITISDLGCRVATAQAAKNIQLAIYASNATTCRPTGSALSSTASITLASVANVSAALGANVQLTAGSVYWLASNVDSTTAVMASISLAGHFIPGLMGSTTINDLWSGGQAATIMGVSTAQTFGTWPDLTAASFTVLANSGTMTNIAFKVASIP